MEKTFLLLMESKLSRYLLCVFTVSNVANRLLATFCKKLLILVSVGMYFSHDFYPHMPIGMLGIYRLLFFSFFILSAGFLVRDISGVG